MFHNKNHLKVVDSMRLTLLQIATYQVKELKLQIVELQELSEWLLQIIQNKKILKPGKWN